MADTALSRVLAFAVLANNNPVEVFRTAVGEGRSCATEDAGGTNIDILIECLADWKDKTP